MNNFISYLLGLTIIVTSTEILAEPKAYIEDRGSFYNVKLFNGNERVGTILKYDHYAQPDTLSCGATNIAAYLDFESKKLGSDVQYNDETIKMIFKNADTDKSNSLNPSEMKNYLKYITDILNKKFLITGTIRLPLGNAVAIPILISFFTMILSPSTLALIIGNFLIQFTIASIKIGVNVIFSPYCFKNAFLFLSLQLMFISTSST